MSLMYLSVRLKGNSLLSVTVFVATLTILTTWLATSLNLSQTDVLLYALSRPFLTTVAVSVPFYLVCLVIDPPDVYFSSICLCFSFYVSFLFVAH